ncbi:MAG: hypothetical protein EA402_08845 [Planctomycetota bacterium]|nr:MAG: hypothetical protein EA402_08845 [Planctomycetota bacterium]
MFNSLSQRFASPEAHIERLIKQVGEDIQKRAMRIGPTFDDDFAPLFAYTTSLLTELLGNRSSAAPQAPVVEWNRKQATKNDIASALHVAFCTLLALLDAQHPSRTRRLSLGLNACFAGTGQATAPYDLVRKTLERKGSIAAMMHLRDGLLRILRRCGLAPGRDESAFGQRFALLTAYAEPQLRRLYPGTQPSIR